MVDRIGVAARRAGRDPSDVQVVAVTKGVPASRVRAALAAGIDTFGENRVQEADAKIAEVGGTGSWHLIGHLQSNKAARAVALFDVVESVDSLELAARLSRLAPDAREGRPLPVYLQVNVDRDPDKAGFDPADMSDELPRALGLPGIAVQGLMTVGRLVTDPEAARPTFRALRQLRDELAVSHPELSTGLSMGMSDDFEVAVEEGATVVRIGRALFGDRLA
ncbi:MAG: YggS family pyridoxal phosphate-dependent enzyme [Candidatus Limnocylindrales bacterium]